MPDIDNKVVSISFNNKQFLRDVEDTISVIEELNDATSGKKIDSSGIENLGRAFRNTTGDLTKQADSVVSAFNSIQSAANTNFQTGGIDALRKALENTGMTATDVEDTITSLQQLSRTGVSYASDLGVSSTAQQIQNESANTRSVLTQDIDDVSNHFSAFEMIAMGAMIAIGEKAADIGANALRSLTSGIRDGWGEYNALTNSTQTILVNTQRWGSTMEDVSGALSILNEYADRTTYSFSDMTRNIGYFTTAGVQLQDSIDAIQGLSNVGAMFGADAQSVARAGYQISQAMSAGVIKLMDWRSMINAGMGGQALQDELIRTAAVMSGTSVDAMNEYIESLGGFNASLQEGWLTSDIFLETMKVFAGQSRDYYRSLTDANGERLYSDEEIDRLVKLGETAMESATQVRTFQQMIDAFKESIGSGWARTFQTIIGNLEEAKEFWTPINNILTSLVDRFFTLQNASLELWRTLGGREELMQGIQNALTALSDVLGAIGRGFIAAFGGTNTIGSRLVGITEAITDFTESLMLSEEELGFVQDFFTGLFEPISLVVDIIFELIKAFFDAGDSALGLEHSADGLYDTVGRFRYALLAVLGYIGNVLKTGANFIKQSRIIRTVVQSLVKIITKTFGGLVKIISAPFVALWQVWDKYNITEKLDEFATKVAEFFLPLVDAISEVNEVISDWFDTFVDSISNTITALDPIETLVQVFTSLKQLFRDLFDPTVSVSDAFSNFFDTMSNSNLAAIFGAIQSSFSDLWSALKETAIGQWFEDLGTRIQNGVAAFAETSFGQKIIEISNALRDFLGIDTSDWSIFWEATKLMLTDVADAIGTGWEKIKTFFTELVNIVKGWFGFADSEDGSVGESIDDMVGTADSSAMEDKIDVMEKTGGAIVSFMENTSKAVAAAEKLIPDPSESKFLGFIDDLPTKLTALADSVSDGTIIEKVTSFFSGLFTSISEFFSGISFDSGEDILTWLADKARVVAEIVGDFLGIQIVDLADKGVFGVIGAMLAAIFNWFGDIDMAALATIDRISKTVSRVLMAIISLKIVGTISSLADAAKAGAKGWQQQQAAKKLSALADVFKSIAVFIIGIGAVIGMLAIALNSEYVTPWQLIGISALIVILLGALFGGIFAIEKAAKDIKPGSFTGISKILSKMGMLLISIVLSIAAILGLAYLAYKIFTSSDVNAVEFGIILGIIGVAFYAIVVAVGVLLGVMIAFSKKIQEASDGMSAISSVVKSVSGLLISVIILLAGILASVAAFTYFIYLVRQNHAWDDLVFAAAFVGIILLAAGLAVAALIGIAKKMSSGISGVKPSDFKQIMIIMSGLLVTVMSSIVILIMAMTGLVALMSSSDVSPVTFMLAAAMVSGLLLAVFGGLSWIFSSMNKMAGKKMPNLWSTFIMVVGIMALVGFGVYALIEEANKIAETTSDLWTLAGTLLTFAGFFALVIAAIAAVVLMASNIDLGKATPKRLTTLTAIAAGVVAAMVAICGAMSVLVISMGASGFLSNGGSIFEVAFAIVGLMTALTVIIAALSALAQNKVLSTKNLIEVAGAIVIMSVAFIAISAALSALVIAIGEGGHIWQAVISMTLLFGALTVALVVLSSIAKLDIGAMLSAAIAMTLASVSFRVIAWALESIAAIDTKQLITAGVVLGAMFIVMGTLLAIISAIGMGTGGIGIVAIGAAALALVLLSSSFLILAQSIKTTGEGLTLVATGIDNFVTSFNNLINLDVSGVKDKMMDLLKAVMAFGNGLKKVVPVFGAIMFELVKSIISGLVSGFVLGFGDAFLQISQSIIDNAPTIGLAFTTLMATIAESLHAALLSFAEEIVADFGPDGSIRTMLSTLQDFALWFAGEVSGWAVDIITAFISGLASTLSDDNQLDRLITSIKILWNTVKKAFMDNLGFPNLMAVGSHIILEILRGASNAITAIAEGTMAPAMQALLAAAGIDINEVASSVNDTLYSASNMAAGDIFDSDAVGAEIDALRDHLEELSNATERATYTGPSYDPTEYYRSISGAASEATTATQEYTDTATSSAASLSGIFNNLNIGDALSNIDLSSITNLFSGNTSGGGLLGGLSSVTGLLGNSNVSGIIDKLGQLTNGNGLLSTIGNLVNGGGLSSLFSGDGLSSLFSGDGFNLSTALSGLIPDDVLNPVITPTVDTSGIPLGINTITDLFNKANVDQFAIDAGNSMLVREAAEGDASKNGNVTYKFTQINQSPKELSPIQIYRDTKNLFRGVVNT